MSQVPQASLPWVALTLKAQSSCIYLPRTGIHHHMRCVLSTRALKARPDPAPATPQPLGYLQGCLSVSETQCRFSRPSLFHQDYFSLFAGSIPIPLKSRLPKDVLNDTPKHTASFREQITLPHLVHISIPAYILYINIYCTNMNIQNYNI